MADLTKAKTDESFHDADVERREPIYEPEDTIRFPASSGLGPHTGDDLRDSEGVAGDTLALKGARDDVQLQRSIFTFRATVAQTPVRLLSGVPGGQSRGGIRKAVSIFNNSANLIEVAGSEETCVFGQCYPIPANTGFTFDKEPWGDFWLISGTGSNDVRCIVEQGYGGAI